MTSTKQMTRDQAEAQVMRRTQAAARRRRCRECGCTDNNACVTRGTPCHWVEPDLCSNCSNTTAGGA